MELSVTVNGCALPSRSFAKAGYYKYQESVPEMALTSRPVAVEFTLSKALPPGDHDRRELGLIVSSVRLS